MSDDAYNDFLDAFAETSGLDPSEADEQWARFSCALSDRERGEIENGGAESGDEMGKKFARLYPIAQRSRLSRKRIEKE